MGCRSVQKHSDKLKWASQVGLIHGSFCALPLSSHLPPLSLDIIVLAPTAFTATTTETEKYAHVTFFFNGGVEKQFENEVRHMIPSPKVPTYDKQPEMSVQGVADKVAEVVKSNEFDFVMCNFAPPDMVSVGVISRVAGVNGWGTAVDFQEYHADGSCSLDLSSIAQVGHTGVYEAAVEAITATDKAVKTVYEACKEAGYVLVRGRHCILA